MAQRMDQWSDLCRHCECAFVRMDNEARGEVWLHEWLHGVCAHFAQRGHVMPERDADGGELHGYVRSPTAGWTDYYRDLMSGKVLEGGKRLGIPGDAWMA